MTHAEIFAQVQTLMVELFELSPEQVTLEAHIVNDLDLDSLDAVDMAVRLEEITGHRVDEAALRSVRTVSDVVGLVDTIVNPRVPDPN